MDKWMNEWMEKSIYQRMNEWTTEWMNQNDWMSELIEWMSE